MVAEHYVRLPPLFVSHVLLKMYVSCVGVLCLTLSAILAISVNYCYKESNMYGRI